MSGKSSIEWTGPTWNPVRGCRKISPGCKHCYAETFAERWRGVKGHAYEQGFDPRLVPDKLSAPFAWKTPQVIFVNSMSDLFLEEFPNEYIAAVYAVMGLAGHHTFQVLTKRSARAREWYQWVARTTTSDVSELFLDPTVDIAVSRCLTWLDRLAPDFPPVPPAIGAASIKAQGPTAGERWPFKNVWLGVSVESQKYAAERIPDLLLTPAAVRFLSCEPLLEALDLNGYMPAWTCRQCNAFMQGRPDVAADEGEASPLCSRCYSLDVEAHRLDWVITGAESGHGARPMQEDWVRTIRDQCTSADVSFFYKQRLERGRKVSLPVLDGKQWAQFPEVRS